ncbi:hypothetical protein K402DRAFT_18162, partial [Aulographum hederae CBS 113979]
MSSLSQSLLIIDVLLHQYEKEKEKNLSGPEKDLRMVHAIDMGWFVLEKYYALSDDAPVYAAALLLHPSKRAKYINTNWPSSWRENAIAAARKIWQKEYECIAGLETSRSAVDMSFAARQTRDEFDSLMDDMDVTDDTSSSTDDFDAFIHAPPYRITGSPLSWWTKPD